VNTNILVYSHIISSRHHKKARLILVELHASPLPWAIPWPGLFEFLRAVTHPRVFHPSSPVEIALADLSRILGSPPLRLSAEPGSMRS
jgi:predicted nucleic acid-binding protein